MKKFLPFFCCCMLFLSPARADDLDLLTDDMLLGTDAATESSSEAKNSKPGASAENEAEDTKTTGSENNESFFGFIIKPISDFFSSDAEVTAVPAGEKESPLDKSIRLAEGGSLEDEMNLAYMYLYGINGVKSDYNKAFRYYKMAADKNDPIALNNLGSLYFSGIGTPKNTAEALNCFKKSSDLGNDSASLNLAFIYLTGGAKDPARNQKAFELFEKSQKAGNKIADFMLGYAYYKGFATAPDSIKAFKLIKAAAGGKARIDEAQLVLGDMYANGTGTVQNYAGAVSAYMAAVNQGNMEAILKLAEVYSQGKLTPQNPVLAHALYNIAAAQNAPGAAAKRDEIGAAMQLEQLSAAQTTAQNFKTSPSELTAYIRQTYGNNIRSYIDINMPDLSKRNK